MNEAKEECPLCYGVVAVVCIGDDHIVSCTFGCLQKVVKAAKTKEEAIENYKQFRVELGFGADMWGSKIRDGVAED